MCWLNIDAHNLWQIALHHSHYWDTESQLSKSTPINTWEAILQSVIETPKGPITQGKVTTTTREALVAMLHLHYRVCSQNELIKSVFKSLHFGSFVYASLHACDTFCYAYVYVNTHFELIEHTPRFTYTVACKTWSF